MEGHLLRSQLNRQRLIKDSLSAEKKRLPDNIGMDWDPELPWEVAYREVKGFKEQNGHLFLTDKDLLKWAAYQRYYRVTNRIITPEKIAKLDDIGFEWDKEQYRVSLRNYRGLTAAKKYKEKHGDLLVKYPVRVSNDYGEFGLGGWIQEMRREKDNISEDLRRELASIGMVWDAAQFYKDEK